MKLLDLGFVSLLVGLDLPRKRSSDTLFSLLLPFGNLVGVNTVLARKLGKSVLSAHGI
jgi:hypothetical protein